MEIIWSLLFLSATLLWRKLSSWMITNSEGNTCTHSVETLSDSQSAKKKNRRSKLASLVHKMLLTHFMINRAKFYEVVACKEKLRFVCLKIKKKKRKEKSTILFILFAIRFTIRIFIHHWSAYSSAYKH